MEKILKPEQKTYLILCLASGMMDGCAGKEELKADYQIISRIYSNAFAGMIRYGFMPACEAKDGVSFLTLDLEGCVYRCPARTVKNILKAEFAAVEEKLPKAAAMAAEEEARLAAELKNREKRGKPGISSETGQAAAEPVKKPEPPVRGVREPELSMRAEEETASSQDTAARPLPGIFSRFLPKSKKQEALNAAPAVQPIQKEAAVPDVIPQTAEEECGERICHTHYVMLRKTYGTQVTGPYMIQIWPTEVIEMYPERLPSAIFVRAQAPNGTAVCKVSEGRARYIVLEIDNKQFNVFGFWEGGKFITEVAAINKTASIFTMSEEVEQECPEQVSDVFLDQFRSREPHRPEFFVVPVSNVIQEEGTVPIAAFIKVRDKNYPVSARGSGNTLRFTYENVLSEISGWWEDGKFVFAVRPVEEE